MREEHCSICHNILCAHTSYSAFITKLKLQNISPKDCHTQAPKPEPACAATSLKFCYKSYLSLFTFLTLCPSPLPLFKQHGAPVLRLQNKTKQKSENSLFAQFGGVCVPFHLGHLSHSKVGAIPSPCTGGGVFIVSEVLPFLSHLFN